MKYLFIVVILFACNTKRPEPKISSEKLDTISNMQLPAKVHPVVFENAFVKGNKHDSPIGVIDLYGINVGKIKIPTGRVIACDPFLTEEYGIPFTQQFPTGEFPLQFSIGKLDDQEQIMFARILFSEKPVVKWEYALLKGQSSEPIESDKIRGYIIDSGTGSFMDEATKKIIDTMNHDKYQAQVYKAMKEHYRLRWQYAMPAIGAQNIAVFSSGGDGYYNSYIGYDTTGMPCRLLTDFGVLNWRNK